MYTICVNANIRLAAGRRRGEDCKALNYYTTVVAE